MIINCPYCGYALPTDPARTAEIDGKRYHHRCVDAVLDQKERAVKAKPDESWFIRQDQQTGLVTVKVYGRSWLFTSTTSIYRAMADIVPGLLAHVAAKAEQEEAPSDLSVLRRIHKLLVNQVRPALRSPLITKDVDDAAEALSALMSRTQTEAPSDSTLKLAEMILADCGHSTAISTRLRDRVAERIERHLAAQPTEASCRSTNADGHVLLPFEPTDEMEVAAEDAYEESGSPFPNWKAVYRAMRDAAPSPDGKAEQALASSDPEGHRQAITDHEAEQAEASSENQRNDSVVDRYLRNNLDDDDYAAFSAALGCLYAPQAEAPSDAAREVLAAGIVHHYGVPEEASFACARRVLALASKPTAGPEQAEAPSDADPLTPEQEEWVMDLAEKHNLGRRVPQIGAMRGVAPDVFYTDASYRTHELFCFAAALLSTKELT